jgi:hypothetical protein
VVPDRFEFAGAKQLMRLLDAVMAIGSEQSLADALRPITEVGAEVVDARYAALGVLNESRSRLAELITVGFSDEETTRMWEDQRDIPRLLARENQLPPRNSAVRSSDGTWCSEASAT